HLRVEVRVEELRTGAGLLRRLLDAGPGRLRERVRGGEAEEGDLLHLGVPAARGPARGSRALAAASAAAGRRDEQDGRRCCGDRAPSESSCSLHLCLPSPSWRASASTPYMSRADAGVTC